MSNLKYLDSLGCLTVFTLFVEIVRHILDSLINNNNDDEYWCVLFSVIKTTNGPKDISEREWYEH